MARSLQEKARLVPIVAGIHRLGSAADAEALRPRAERLWTTLTRDLGVALSGVDTGTLRAAVFAQCEGDRAIAPRAREGTVLGFGGDEAGTTPAAAAPPWLSCSHDPARRTTVVATDRHGFALLYVRRFDGLVAFCSSAVALARTPPALEPDADAIAELVAFDHLLGSRTLRRGVSCLPQGTDLVIEAEGVRHERSFRYRDVPLSTNRSADEAAAALVPLWRRAVASVLAQSGGEPLLVSLSGGLDSRLLAATAVELGASVDAYSFGHTQPGRAPPDVTIAQQVARTLGASWRGLPLEDDWLVATARKAAALTDGHLDLVHSYGASLLDRVPKGRLRLDGLAGDVVLGGSFVDDSLLRPHLSDPGAAMLRVEALWRARSRIDHPAWSALLSTDAKGEMIARARAALAASLSDVDSDPQPDARWAELWVLEHRIRRFTVCGSLLWQAAGRSVFPFFAPGWIDSLLALHPEVRRDAELQASFFHAAYPAMASIPWQKTGRPVPRPENARLRRLARRLASPRAATALRRAHAWLHPPAFAPGAPFFDFDAALCRSPRLQAALRETLLDGRAGVDRFGCFERSQVERLLADASSGRRRGMAQLGALFTLVIAEELWSS